MLNEIYMIYQECSSGMSGPDWSPVSKNLYATVDGAINDLLSGVDKESEIEIKDSPERGYFSKEDGCVKTINIIRDDKGKFNYCRWTYFIVALKIKP